MTSLVLTDSSQLRDDGFEKLPDQIMYPYAEPYDLQTHRAREKPFRENHPQFNRPGLKHDLLVISSLVYYESSALDHAATKEAFGSSLHGTHPACNKRDQSTMSVYVQPGTLLQPWLLAFRHVMVSNGGKELRWIVFCIILVVLAGPSSQVPASTSEKLWEEISDVKTMMVTISDELQKFNSLYLSKLEYRMVSMATTLSSLDSNIKNLQERAHVWDTFQLHVSAWNEQINTLDKKMDILSRGQNKLLLVDGKVNSLLSLDYKMERMLEKMEEADDKLNSLGKTLESQSSGPLFSEFATRGALSTLKLIERKVDRIYGGLAQYGKPTAAHPGGHKPNKHRGDLAGGEESSKGKLVIRCNTPIIVEELLKDVSSKVDVIFDKVSQEEEDVILLKTALGDMQSTSSEGVEELNQPPEMKLLDKLWKRLTSPSKKTARALEGLESSVRFLGNTTSILMQDQAAVLDRLVTCCHRTGVELGTFTGNTELLLKRTESALNGLAHQGNSSMQVVEGLLREQRRLLEARGCGQYPGTVPEVSPAPAPAPTPPDVDLGSGDLEYIPAGRDDSEDGVQRWKISLSPTSYLPSGLAAFRNYRTSHVKVVWLQTNAYRGKDRKMPPVVFKASLTHPGSVVTGKMHITVNSATHAEMLADSSRAEGIEVEAWCILGKKGLRECGWRGPRCESWRSQVMRATISPSTPARARPVQFGPEGVEPDRQGLLYPVIQRRGSYRGSRQNFSLPWVEYKGGFGQLEQEFWFGNDFIHSYRASFIVRLGKVQGSLFVPAPNSIPLGFSSALKRSKTTTETSSSAPGKLSSVYKDSSSNSQLSTSDTQKKKSARQQKRRKPFLDTSSDSSSYDETEVIYVSTDNEDSDDNVDCQFCGKPFSGDKCGEKWISCGKCYQWCHELLTSEREVELRVELEAFNGSTAWAQYNTFRVDSEEHGYRLSVGGYSGNATDSLSEHNNKPFSTVDRTNDEAPPCCPCAPAYGGGWWFYSCFESNLNGVYYSPGDEPSRDSYRGLIWEHWLGDHSLRASVMMVRDRDYGFDDTIIPEDP
uniref:Fibrinogen C-terminal domain-containing protein n=1 Tax=Timema shepardi TaxID=629360 RepID=A0A7R9FYM3_TIMSH|nr:unnamed protein product [Timema shepardi]